MSDKVCDITGCPALAEDGSRWCAVHRAMTPEQRGQEQREGERREFQLPPVRPTLTRIKEQQ